MKIIDVDQLSLLRIPHTPQNHMRAPWIQETVEASYLGEKIAYLKICYVPGNRIAAFEKDPFLVLDFFGGDRFYNHVYEGKIASSSNNQEEGDAWMSHLLPLYAKQAKWVIKNVLIQKRSYDYSQTQPLLDFCDKATDQELIDFLKLHHKATLKVINKTYQSTLDYHFARPEVGYIHVEEAYRGQRIALRLYQEASRWMNEKGLLFYASCLQSSSAASAWAKMHSEGRADKVVIKNNKRDHEERSRFRFIENAPSAWLDPDFKFPASVAQSTYRPRQLR